MQGNVQDLVIPSAVSVGFSLDSESMPLDSILIQSSLDISTACHGRLCDQIFIKLGLAV